MGRGTKFIITAAAAATLLIVAPSGLAASPQQIYDDLADNGVLDRTYSRAELEAALRDPAVHVYGHAAVLPTLKEVTKEQPPQAAVAAAQQGQLPFTGAEMALFAAVGAALVGSGLILRRTAREP